MSITYRIDPEQEFIEVVLTGMISVVGLIRTARDIMDEPTFDPLFDVLADCADARIGRVTFDLAEAMAAINAGNEARRIAIVLPKGDAAKHATRFVALREKRRAQTFADRSGAEAWLANPPPKIAAQSH
jgi:thioredoxin-like negative regulator of GroEL